MKSRRAFTIVELVVVTLFIGLLIVFLRPAVREIRAKARIFGCADNLREISVALRLYAGEHKEKFPERLASLLEEGYVSSGRVFDCPGSGRAGTAKDPDYLYSTGLDLMSPSDSVLVEDEKENHGRLGRNVLYVSGDIEWHGAVTE